MAVTASKGGADTGILLEAGTNELEILIIEVGGGWYGVNVAKVREVLESIRPTRLPESHPAVEGTVAIRGDVVQLVNLAQFIGGKAETSRPKNSDKMLIMEFNQQTIAFRVHGVDTIMRTSWANVQPMPRLDTLSVPVTSIVLLQERMILMLDFEAIGASVGMSRQTLEEADSQHDAPQAAEPILHGPVIFAEDSAMTHKLIESELRLAGCPSYRGFRDGREAWEYLCELAARSTPETIHEKVSGVVSDVEMPRMDGLSLTHGIRKDPVLGDLPVVLFSSIVSKDNEKKGVQVGADAQIAKGNYRQLVRTLAEAIARRSEQRQKAKTPAAARADG